MVDYLKADSPARFVEALEERREDYAPFILIMLERFLLNTQ